MSDTAGLTHDSPLWRFGVTLYGQPGVRKWLLGLQDRLAVEVNFVLLAGWCSRHGLMLSLADWQQLDAATGSLRQTLIAPLRRQRRRLAATAPSLVHHHLLQAELAAENALYEQLWQWWCAEHVVLAPALLPQIERSSAMNLAGLASFYGMNRFEGVEPLVVAVCQLAQRQSAGDSEGGDELPF